MAVQTSTPSAVWRNWFQHSFFAFLMARHSSRLTFWIRFIPARPSVAPASPSYFLRSGNSKFHHTLDRLHHRFLRACWSKLPTIASRSGKAAPSTSSTFWCLWVLGSAGCLCGNIPGLGPAWLLQYWPPPSPSPFCKDVWSTICYGEDIHNLFPVHSPTELFWNDRPFPLALLPHGKIK